jgi:hypothetical protein
MFVDDIFGCCWRRDLESELAVTRKVCTDLMWSLAIKDAKTESGRTLTVIGYTIQLDGRQIVIAERNVQRALYGLLAVKADEPVEVRIMQRLASWGLRCGYGNRGMRPFVTALFHSYTKRRANVTLCWEGMPEERSPCFKLSWRYLP